MTRERLLLVTRIVLIALVAATLAFIFGNSILPPDESKEQSDTVKDIILEILPDGSPAESFVEQYIRKIAHFSEYGLLGIEVALYMIILERRRLRFAPLSLIFALLVSFTDESIQMFTERGPAIMDVWIDVGGFAFFSLITYAVFALSLLAALAVRALRARKNTELE